MLFCNRVLVLLMLYFVSMTICKPTQNDITEGRGIGSTIWSWLTYPFSWWSSSEESLPVNEQLIRSTTLGPYENVEVERHNVTVWCNEQTCTTMRCDKLGCKNTTCNIYDTNLTGECREFVTKPEESPLTKPTEPAPQPSFQGTVTVSQQQKPATEPQQKATTKPTQPPVAVVTNAPDNNPAVDERPLELEAVLSSTVSDQDKKGEAESKTNVGHKVKMPPKGQI